MCSQLVLSRTGVLSSQLVVDECFVTAVLECCKFEWLVSLRCKWLQGSALNVDPNNLMTLLYGMFAGVLPHGELAVGGSNPGQLLVQVRIGVWATELSACIGTHNCGTCDCAQRMKCPKRK
jgi:hypothetical protein